MNGSSLDQQFTALVDGFAQHVCEHRKVSYLRLKLNYFSVPPGNYASKLCFLINIYCCTPPVKKKGKNTDWINLEYQLTDNSYMRESAVSQHIKMHLKYNLSMYFVLLIEPMNAWKKLFWHIHWSCNYFLLLSEKNTS